MSHRLDWSRDGPSWPNREFSRFVQAGGLRWHVQIMGEGPPLLLLHGTGASAHSWRDAAAILKDQFTVVIPDLPGHGFTGLPPLSRLSLPGVSSALAHLLSALDIQPARCAGHSAGAAILARLALDKRITPDFLISFNGAFFPFGGAAASFFSPLAKLLVWNPLAPRLFAHMADARSVKRLLDDTGSRLSPEGIALYQRLFESHPHVSGALGMMAAWDLHGLQNDIPRLGPRLMLVKSSGDRSIPPESAGRLAARVPGSSVIALQGLGHLAHEEDPALAARIILSPSDFAAMPPSGKQDSVA
jgi:magnesium chelatase accessory protein